MLKLCSGSNLSNAMIYHIFEISKNNFILSCPMSKDQTDDGVNYKL